MRKLIFFLFMALIGFTAFAQLPPNIEEGKHYRFISRSTEDTTKAIELTVVYDKQGNAKISSQIMNAIHDGFTSYLIGLKGELVSTLDGMKMNDELGIKLNDDYFNIIYFTSSDKKFLISFDYPKTQYILKQDTLTLHCLCDEEKSSCFSDYVFGFNGTFVDILFFANNQCHTYTTFKTKEPITLEGGFLVIKAKSVTLN